MTVTPQALDELKKVLNSEDTPFAGIRIFTQQGCCGPAVQMSVVERAFDGDKQISVDSLNFFVDKPTEEILAGVTIDFGPNGFKLEGMKRNGGCCG